MNKNPLQVGGGVCKTPPSDTRCGKKDIFLCHDWLTCTFDFFQMSYKFAPLYSWQKKEYDEGLDKLNRLYDLLTYPDKKERYYEDINLAGYHDGYIVLGEYIKIWFTGAINSNKLHHNKLEMSGQACKDFISRGGDFNKLMDWLLINGAKFTRVDAAIDVMSLKYFTFEKLLFYSKNMYYVSPMRKGKTIKSWDKSTRTYDGDTIYIGSESSNTLICIYDKILEQFSRGIIVNSEAWIRIEIRFKQDRAMWYVGEFLNHNKGDNDYSFIMSALYAVLEFKEPTKNGNLTNDSNISRWDKADWWLKFLGNVEKADFKKDDDEPQTIERKKLWMDKSVSKTLSQLYYYDPNEFIQFIYKLVYKRDEDLTNTDTTMINNYRKKKKLPLLTDEEIDKLSNDLTNLITSLGVDLDE